MKVFKREEEYVTGKLDMEALLITKGRTKEDLIKGLRGFINISLREGRLKKSNTLIKVLNSMSLQKIFKEIPSDVSKEGFYYESIRGYGVIDDGIIHTADWVMKSPVLNAVASGSMMIPSGTVDYNLGIQPLESVDAVVSRIPLIGYILAGKDKKFLTYYFEVKGPIGEAEVKYIPFKHLGKGVAGAMKRLFMTPVRLFKEIPKPTEDGKGSNLELPDDD